MIGLIRFFIIGFYWLATVTIANELALTQAQQQWLKAHPDIRIGIDQHWYPVEYVDNDGMAAGISNDIVQLMVQQSNIDLTYNNQLSWSEVIERAKNKQIDLVSAVGKTKEREEFWLYSKPYLATKTVFVTKNNYLNTGLKWTNNLDHRSLDTWYQGQLAVVKDYPTHSRIKNEWPDIPLLLKPTQMALLQALQSGEADVAVINLDTALPIINAHHMMDLNIHGDVFSEPEYVYFAARKDWPELIEIINANLDFIGSTEIERIRQKWAATSVELGISKENIIFAFAGFIVIVGLILIYVLLLKRSKKKIEAIVKSQSNDLFNNYQRLKDQNNNRAALSKMNFDRPLLALFQELSYNVATTLTVERVSIWRYNQEKTKLNGVNLYQHSTDQHTAAGVLAVKDFPSYFAALDRDRILAIDDTMTDVRIQEFAPEYLPSNNIVSMLDLPIMVDGNVYGVLCLEQTNKPRQWTEDEIGYAVSVSDFASLMIESSNRRANMDTLISQSRHVVMGEMIAMLVHQWKQPLTTLMLKTGTIKDKLSTMKVDDADSAFLIGQLDGVESVLEDQNHMIQDFRDFFHPDKDSALFSLSEAVLSSIDILDNQLTKYHIDVDINIDSQIAVFGFERDFRHVMINILNNAIDQIADHKTSCPIIKLTAKPAERVINLAIEDNAGGVDKAIINTIFEPYASTKKLNGTGLGLYISKRIMQDSFRSNIFVENTATGAKFSMALPRQGGVGDKLHLKK